MDISDGKNVIAEFSTKFGPERVIYNRADVTSDSDMEGEVYYDLDRP